MSQYTKTISAFVSQPTTLLVPPDLCNATSCNDDTEIFHVDTALYNFILLSPFIFIPLCIIFGRLVDYFIKLAESRKYGIESDLLGDPMAQLGLNFGSRETNASKVDRIKREQALLKELKQRKESAKNTKPTTVYEEKLLQIKNSRLGYQFKKLESTYKERFSPDSVREWFTTSRYARLWMMFQIFCTIASIFNYILLTYTIARSDKATIKYFDVALAGIFALDYALSLYIAEDRLQFYFNGSSMIDLISIVPPFVYVFITDSGQYVWFLGLLRILRMGRILRTYRLLSFSETEAKRELTLLALYFVNFIFLAASIINALETVQVSRGQPSLTYWHDSLYYIIVTFSTIGFGDLTPSTVPSRVFVMLLIIAVIIIVPVQTSRLTEILASSSAYQRAIYKIAFDKAHVILSGKMTHSSMADFCREYFMEDSTAHLVILGSTDPSMEVKAILRHPTYRNRLFYLTGSALSVADLKRAQAAHATAIFFLNPEGDCPVSGSEELQVMRGHDSLTLMQSLVVKKACPGLTIYAQLQDIRSKDLSETCGCDRVLCIDEVKMSLLARNCIVPGSLSLVLNLIHSLGETPASMELSGSSSSNMWLQEYMYGAQHQMGSFKIPTGLIGVSFQAVAYELYIVYGIIILGVMSANAGFNANSINLNPGKNYKCKPEDIVFCLIAGNEDIFIQIALQFKDNQFQAAQTQKDLRRELQAAFEQETIVGAPLNLKGGLGEGTSISKSAFVSASVMKEDYNVNDSGTIFRHAELAVDVFPWKKQPMTDTESPLTETPQYSSHIILCGIMTSRGIRHFVKSIRQSGIPNISAINIVCLLEDVPDLESDEIWKDIVKWGNVYVHRGSPLKRSALLMVGVPKCHRIVIFGKNSESDSSPDDAQSVFIVKMLKKEWPAVHFVVELTDGMNVKHFSNKDLDWDTSNLRMQSVVNNYALGVHDRLNIYKHIRTEGAEGKGNWLYQIGRLLSPTDNPPTKKQPPTSKDKPSKNSHSQYKKSGRSTYTRMKRSRSAESDHDQGESIELNDALKPSPSPEQEEDEEEESMPEFSGLNEVHGAANTTTSVPLTEAYMDRLVQEAEMNESGFSPTPVYHLDKSFAMGQVTTSSFMHSLLCHAYFRPYVIDIVEGLCGSLLHVPIPVRFFGKGYGRLVKWSLSEGYVPLGLFRNGRIVLEGKDVVLLENLSGLTAPPHPYVYTNPRSGDVVTELDVLFVL